MESEIEYIWPIEPKYKVTEHDKYGVRINHYVIFKQRAHSGFDITADYGTEVKAIATGKVLYAEFDGTTTEGDDSFNMGYGNKIEIVNADGRRVVYAHLSKIFVRPGDLIAVGTVIGKTGCSGGSRVPHLHIEIRKENTDNTGLDNTLNPLDILPKKDLDSLTERFTQEPYSKLWEKMANDNDPWGFSKEDVWYADDTAFIK